MTMKKFVSSSSSFINADFIAATRLATMSKIHDPVIIELAARCLAAARDAHSCVDLGRLALDELTSFKAEGENLNSSAELVKALRMKLQVVPAVRIIESTDILALRECTNDVRPLVLVDRFLYTQRQFVDELSVAEQFTRRVSGNPGVVSVEALALADLVKPCGTNADANIENDVLRAVDATRLMILTGGPGTGKTTMTITAIAMMMMLSEHPVEDASLALCAPTGKAAARLKEAVQEFLGDPKRSSWVSAPVRAVLERVVPSTIQRLLGRSRSGSTRFRFDSNSRLRQQIVAVDEASMISAQLMARLMEAVDDDARMLLVGDPGQLESVEAGSVLGQLMAGSLGSKESPTGRQSSVFTLRKVWRTGAGSAIPPLADAIRSGNADETINLLAQGGSGIEWEKMIDPSSNPELVAGDVVKELQTVVELSRRKDDALAHKEALKKAGAVKVLCGPREGARGVSFWNSWIAGQLGLTLDDRTSPGRLVLVEQNSPRVGLSNGDIGLLVSTSDGPQAVFAGQPDLRYFPLASLPPVQTCFAMTVHKSQGSEYQDLVVVILPALLSPLLNRQLMYTAITRTKSRVRIVGPENAMRKAVISESGRASGLAELVRLCKNTGRS